MSISYSAYSKYVLCPKMYDYHYNERLRPTGTSSALVFGTMVDEVLNKLILGEHVELTPVPFDGVTFMSTDLDLELLSGEDVTNLIEFARECGYEGSDIFGTIQRLFGRYNDGEDLTVGQRSILFEAVWQSMSAKIGLIVEAYREKVLPLLDHVHGVQVEAGPGFIDLLADVKGYGKVVLDNKTASRPYMRDAVQTSVQLANYADIVGCDKAGFIVIQKVLRKNRIKKCSVCGNDGTGGRHQTCDAKIEGKRCDGTWDMWIKPQAVIDIIIDDVSPRMKYLASEAFAETEKGVAANVYPRNLNQCKYVFGKKCPYFDKCMSDSDVGLERK